MAETGIVEGDRVSIEAVVTGINADGTVSLALDGYTLARITVAEQWAHPDREAHHGACQGEAEAAHSVTMDCLTFFGLVAVTLMLVFYWLEPRNRHYILAFAGACLVALASYLALGPLGGRGDLGGSRGRALG